MPRIAKRTHHTADGREIRLEGRPQIRVPSEPKEMGWVDRKHPDWHLLKFDEDKMRASYLADRRRLVPFLVPHRFEAKDDRDPDTGEPTNLGLRKRLGYGMGLNQAYLSEILGHIRRSEVQYRWGELMGDGGDEFLAEPPEDTTAGRLWSDATREGVGWIDFFDEVLEWMATSPGGFILLDRPQVDADNRRAAEQADKRVFCRFLPWSHIEDWGTGESGLRWVKVPEVRDERGPKDESEKGFTEFRLLYQLTDRGTTLVGRYDEDGNLVGEEVDMGRIEDMEGQPMLPLVPARFGRHPDIPYAGNGLLRGLDDIVLDLWNQVSEMREEQRDIVFSFLHYAGEKGDDVRDQLEAGNRMVNTEPDATLDVKAASGSGVSAGASSIDLALTAWALTAKRKAQEAVETAGPRSGKSIEAEFEVDIKPLLVRLAGALDRVEMNTMFVAAQIEGLSTSQANALGIQRNKEFRVEEEALRISRIVDDFRKALPRMLPGALQKELVMRWFESLSVVDQNREIELDGGETVPLRELVESQLDELAERAQQGARNDLPFGGGFPNLDALDEE